MTSPRTIWELVTAHAERERDLVTRQAFLRDMDVSRFGWLELSYQCFISDAKHPDFNSYS